MKRINIEREVLAKNQDFAEVNRNLMNKHNIFSFNLISSPGSGKTTLLEKTLGALKDEINMAVIEGDIQTDNDAARLSDFGLPVIQINTGGLCHLDASMISRTLEKFDLNVLEIVIIENVGNLVCPSSYDLGENIKIAVMSVTEGDDKPLKYPAIFRKAGVMIINKMDLLDFTDFSVANARRNALSINPRLRIFEMSCRTGQGLEDWYNWVREQVPKVSP